MQDTVLQSQDTVRQLQDKLQDDNRHQHQAEYGMEILKKSVVMRQK
ncbi:MAG: hypothetical protein RPG89_05065 [Microcystis panniformis WG22]|nr:hypothetical protein [Microcystis aeruginosa]MDB9430091.1 hypothetical protein [Microcystis aeruginosa CS-555/01A07]MDY7047993.1 hypothetical protein [Microcystis panniformis WG22]